MIFTHDASLIAHDSSTGGMGISTPQEEKQGEEQNTKFPFIDLWRVNKSLHSSELRSYLITWQILPFVRSKATALDLLYSVTAVFQDSCLCVREEIQIALTFSPITERVN